MGVQSVSIIVVSGMFIGMVLGLQGFNVLVDFMAEGALGQLVSLSIIRELGQELIYYREIKGMFGTVYKDVLNALRDAACFSKICDEFLDNHIFKISLLREKGADTALQFAQYTLAGVDYDEERSFVFRAKLPYWQEERLSIKFDLGRVEQENNLNRIIAMIGDNGVGKTTVLSQLAKALVNNEKECFSPYMPVFSKVIAASYSIFDSFFNIQGTSYNYVYCGIQSVNHRLMTEEELPEHQTAGNLAQRRRPDTGIHEG